MTEATDYPPWKKCSRCRGMDHAAWHECPCCHVMFCEWCGLIYKEKETEDEDDQDRSTGDTPEFE